MQILCLQNALWRHSAFGKPWADFILMSSSIFRRTLCEGTLSLEDSVKLFYLQKTLKSPPFLEDLLKVLLKVFGLQKALWSASVFRRPCVYALSSEGLVNVLCPQKTPCRPLPSEDLV